MRTLLTRAYQRCGALMPYLRRSSSTLAGSDLVEHLDDPFPVGLRVVMQNPFCDSLRSLIHRGDF